MAAELYRILVMRRLGAACFLRVGGRFQIVPRKTVPKTGSPAVRRFLIWG
jgi:hypothetical protein